MASNEVIIEDIEGVGSGVSPRERTTLLASVLIISICALTYELVIATLSSYLLGNSVTQFSFTIGLFLFAMGLGSLLSRQIKGSELRWFIIVELLTGLFGGFSAIILYGIYATNDVYYYTVMILLILAVGICIGLEIPLLMRIVANHANLSKALADVLSVDYLGALVGSLAFPLVLLPMLGVTLTAFLMGLCNVIVAALNLALFQSRLRNVWKRRLWVSVIIISILMAGGAILSADLVKLLEQQLYTDHIIYRAQSVYQRIVITRGGSDVRLFLDGNLQFSSRDEYRYHEPLVHPVMSIANSRETVVILGGGDGLAVRELLQYPDVKRIIVVDLDPAITALAQTYPMLKEINKDALSDPRVEVINQDAYKFIEDSEDQYPVILIDLPDPNNESLSKLYSQQFYRILRKRLTPDGIFITQATSPYFSRKAYWCIAHTVQASDFHIIPMRVNIPSFGEWGFVIGTANRNARLNVPKGLTLRYLTEDVLSIAQVFDPDMADEPTEINTLDKPILLSYYEEGWRQWN